MANETAKKLSSEVLLNLGMTIVLTNAELMTMPEEERDLFLVGMTVASQVHKKELPLDDVMRRMVKSEWLESRREMIMKGFEAMQKAIDHTLKITAPKPGATLICVLIACEQLPRDGKFVGETRRMGSFPSIEAAHQFVEQGGLPEDMPFFAVLTPHVNFYVLASADQEDEEMRESNDLLNYVILSGPHSTSFEAEEILKKIDKADWKGVVLGCLTDEDAALVKRIGGLQ